MTLFDVRPICPGCKLPADVLGQWFPGNPCHLCKRCSRSYPMPDVLERNDAKKRGVVVRKDSDEAERTRMVSMENSLVRLHRGCVYSLDDWTLENGLPCESLDHEPYFNCPLCIKELKNFTRRLATGEPESLAWVKRDQQRTYPKAREVTEQYRLPLCKVCGCAHDQRHADGLPKPLCQSCQDQQDLETLWKMRVIHDGRDVEDILDVMQSAYPGLFERGILPDAWFKLMREQ